jgi:hypothetical protein
MNQREAMRYASGMVAARVYKMAEETGPASLPFPTADRDRVENALLLIANRLEDTAAGLRGKKKEQVTPPDPNQVALFE